MKWSVRLKRNIKRSFRQKRSNVQNAYDSDLWFRPKVGEVCDHIVEDRVLVGSAGITPPRSMLLLLLVGLLRLLVGRIRVPTWLLLLLLVTDWVAGVGVLSV